MATTTNSVTFTIPAVSITDSVTKATLNIPAHAATISVPTSSTSPPPPPPPPPPPTGVTWMYLNGVKTLAGDFTGQGTQVNYSHKVTGDQLNGGTTDIQLTTSGAGQQWPYFLPYFAADYRLPNPGWTNVLVSIKPTVTGQAFGVHMERVGDSPLPPVELLNYGPPTVAGKWSSYVIPLKDLGTYGDATLYKILIQDHSATSQGFEVDALGFQ
jgi:hypothetical protein